MNQAASSSILVATLVLVFGVAAEAQQQTKIPKVGLLTSGSSSSGIRFEVLRRGLHELGYAEGKNITFEHRYGEDNFDRLPSLVDQLIGLKVDVLVVTSTPAALAPKNATRTVPIIFSGCQILLELG